MESASSAVTQSFSGLVAVRGAVAVFVVLTILLIVLIIAYLVWRMNRSQMTSVKVLSDPTKLNNNAIQAFAAAKLPALSVGQPFSGSFWLYLTNYVPGPNGKLILWRQNPANTSSNFTVAGTNPVVFMDPSVNKMYVCVATTRNTPTPTNLMDLLKTSGSYANNNNQWTYLTATVDYVPLQRWVNYTFTVQDNLLSLYQDGSLYTVASLFDMIDQTGIPTSTNYVPRPLFSQVVGDLTVGNPLSGVTCTTNSCVDDVTGFIARLQFFNYALTSKQARSIYYAGPGSGSILRILGLPEYGVRSPIYQIDQSGGQNTGSNWDDLTKN